MSKPTIKSLTEQLHKAYLENHLLKTANASLTKSNERLLGSPKVQEQLNMANGKVAELMEEVETLKELADTRLNELRDKAESLKKLYADYAELEKIRNSNDEVFNDLAKKYNALFEETGKINAENHALKQEIERTNRHINLAENVIHEAKEQQLTVVNHYHNCTINK